LAPQNSEEQKSNARIIVHDEDAAFSGQSHDYEQRGCHANAETSGLDGDEPPRYHANQEDDDVAKGKNTRKETKKPKKDKK